MKFVVNGTLHPGKSREDLIAHAKDRSISDEAWDLVRTGVITEHGYKIGQRPGFFLVIEGDSEEAVHSTVSALPFLPARRLVRHRGGSDHSVPLRRPLARAPTQ